MRFIQKGAEPRELLNWKLNNAATPQNLIYGKGNFPSEAIRQALLVEQFYLCAYTMRTLQGASTRDSCHIEHLWPQARKIPAEAIDYQNMLACYPASNSKEACEYGAQYKKNYDPAIQPFVSPLSTSVESHFDFDKNGDVSGLTHDGRVTVSVLNLKHKALVNDRRAVIKGWLEPKKGRPLTASAARRLSVEITKPNMNNRLSQFCVAVAQVAVEHADRSERRAAQLSGRVVR